MKKQTAGWRWDTCTTHLQCPVEDSHILFAQSHKPQYILLGFYVTVQHTKYCIVERLIRIWMEWHKFVFSPDVSTETN